MAITATIQHRRGNKKDFNASKMVPAELAMALDTRQVFAAFAPGDVKELASTEDVENLIGDFQGVVSDEISAAKKEIQNAGQEVLNSIPDDFEEVAAKADEAVRTKSDAIICTSTGNPAVAKDSSDDYLRGLNTFGKSTQVSTTGKNLMENTAVSQTANGVTFTVNKDGSVTANGTASADAYLVLDNNIGINNNDSYVLSGTPVGGSLNTFYTRISDHKTVAHDDYGNSETFSYADVSECELYIMIKSGTTVQNLTFYPMIRLASIEDATYEPYTGGKPSPSPEYEQPLIDCGILNADTGEYEIETAVDGKNLLENTATSKKVNGITFTVNDDGTVTVSGTATSNATLNINRLVLQAGSYIISGCADGGDIGIYRIYVTDEYAFTYVSLGSNYNQTFSITEETTVVVAIQIYNGITISNLTFYPMIRKAEITDDTYVPYNKQSLIHTGSLPGIPLGTTIPTAIANSPVHMAGVYWDEAEQQYYIGDTVEYGRGKYVKRIGVENLSAKEWSVQVEGHISCPKGNIPSYQVSTIMCNIVGMEFISTGGNYLNIETDLSLAEFQNAIRDIDTYAYYILATPIETDLPASEITAYNALHSNYPVTVVSNDSGAHQEMEYFKHTKNGEVVGGIYEENRTLKTELAEVKATLSELMAATLALNQE